MNGSKVNSIVAGPRLARTASGLNFDIYSDRWLLKDTGNRDIINMGAIVHLVGPQLQNSIRTVFAAIAGGRPGNTAANWFYIFRNLVECAAIETGSPVVQIEAEHVSIWAHKSGGTGITALSHILSVISTWEKLRAPGVTEEAIDLVKRLRRPKDPAILGAVFSWDPVQGPYRPADDEAIREALDRAFNDGTMSLVNYAMFRSFRATGARPESISQLKVGDLRAEGDQSFLRIPMIKQHGKAWREAFMPWKPVTQGFSNILTMHIEANIRPNILKGVDIDQVPIFPEQSFEIDSDQNNHIRTITLGKTYINLFKKLNIISPLSGEVIHGTPKRDRHTYLTMLAMRGCSPEEIAANAGQSKVSSCEPYVHAAIGHFQRMEQFVGSSFVPLADRFAGTIVSEAVDKHANDALLDDTATAVGSCGIGGCSAIEAGVAPVACYTCRKFRAWSDAPHLQLLEKLIEAQELQRDNGHDAVAETTTATMIAITDLLERIRVEREKENG